MRAHFGVLVFVSCMTGCMGGPLESDGGPPGSDAANDAQTGWLEDAGGSDAGLNADAGGRTDAAPDAATRDAGPLPPMRVDWELDAWEVYSGTVLRVTAVLTDRVDVEGDLPLEITIGSGTSTGQFGAVEFEGAGRYSVEFEARAEGTPIRFRAEVGGSMVGDLSEPLSIVVPLLHYTAEGDAESLADVGGNLSGVTWNPATSEFLLIRNNDRMLHVLAPSFAHRAAVTLHSVPISSDLEDIVYLGGPESAPEYAVVDEAGNIAIGVIPPEVGLGLDMREWQTVRYADRPARGNKGGEGLAYDPVGRRFWACTEQSPMAVYEFARPPAGVDTSYESGLVVTQPFDAQAALGSMITDISSCLYDARTGRLLVLSDESSRVLDVGFDGTVYATMPVAGAPQFEGLTLHEDGHLLAVSEPNRYRAYRYEGPLP